MHACLKIDRHITKLVLFVFKIMWAPDKSFKRWLVCDQPYCITDYNFSSSNDIKEGCLFFFIVFIGTSGPSPPLYPDCSVQSLVPQDGQHPLRACLSWAQLSLELVRTGGTRLVKMHVCEVFFGGWHSYGLDAWSHLDIVLLITMTLTFLSLPTEVPINHLHLMHRYCVNNEKKITFLSRQVRDSPWHHLVYWKIAHNGGAKNLWAAGEWNWLASGLFFH